MLSYRDRRRIREEEAVKASAARANAAKDAEAPRSRLAWLDAPITLWLLSALAISLFGSVYSGARQCRSDAEKVIEEHTQLADELYHRRLALLQTIAKANTIDAVKIAAADRSHYTHMQFRDWMNKELQDRYLGLYVGPRSMAMIAFVGSDKWRLPSLDVEALLSATDADLKDIKKAAVGERAILERERYFSYASREAPRCGLITVAWSMATASSRPTIDILSDELASDILRSKGGSNRQGAP